jgi:hypothetical protein
MHAAAPWVLRELAATLSWPRIAARVAVRVYSAHSKRTAAFLFAELLLSAKSPE